MTMAASPPLAELSADLASYATLLQALQRGAPVDETRTRLTEAAVEMWSRPGFDTFLSQSRLSFEPFDYQWQTAQTVLRRMRRRGHRLWRKTLPAHGLPLTLRCLAAWWRISQDPEFLAANRPSVLAAAIHRMVGYRAAEMGITHDSVAALHQVTAAESRAITPLLQARLRLSPQEPW
ncbi:MAG: hypothetical protein ACRDNZ_21215 [Streptosporangiaceae bacterium]